MKALSIIVLVMSVGCASAIPPAPPPPATPCTPITQDTYKEFGQSALAWCNTITKNLSQSVCLCRASYAEYNFQQAVARHHLTCQEEGLNWSEVSLSDQQEHTCEVQAGWTK
jgi:hypothetical protein